MLVDVVVSAPAFYLVTGGADIITFIYYYYCFNIQIRCSTLPDNNDNYFGNEHQNNTRIN